MSFVQAFFFFFLNPAFQRQATKELGWPLAQLVLCSPPADTHPGALACSVWSLLLKLQSVQSVMETLPISRELYLHSRCDDVSCSRLLRSALWLSGCPVLIDSCSSIVLH